VRVDLATNIPFRIPKTIDLTLQASDIQITRDEVSGRWRVGGSLAIVNGAYTVDFDLADKITPAPAKITPIKPFWDEYPAIGNADVDVSLDVRRFSVVNNVATIDFAGSDIRITGTPRELRLNGSIGVSGRGRFRIPLTRADFRNTTGSIDFAGKVADPKLDLTSIADYPDLSGQTHVITLTIAGSLEQPVWDLKTSTGYNKSQTLSLLFLGRNPEQLRRSLGDQAIGTDPTKIDPSTNPSATVYDQAIKDLAGDWVSGLVGGTVTRATGLDVFRIELGVGTVGATIGKRLVEDNVSATGKYESTVRGQTIDLTVDWRMPYHAPFITGDKLSIQGRYFQKTYNDPADQLLNIQDLRSGVVYRLFIP